MMQCEFTGDGLGSSNEDSQVVQKIRAMIEQALSDGEFSRQERDDIMQVIYADRHITVAKCALMRQVQEKVWLGEVHISQLS
ncbi:MAG: hypothetical protein VKK04_13995 [Synechococcales bacterium]|nr:hypothetical protein [Synechococcales bacterium]